MKFPWRPLILLLLVLPSASLQAQRDTISFCNDWRFDRADVPAAASAKFVDASWEKVALPHTARVEALVSGKKTPQWQGICWYRKTFGLPAEARGKEVILRFEGAMNAAEIWVNGQSVGKFMGGYLPYVMEISALALPGRTNLVAVRLDNRDNPITGPKPLADLDFNLYGGLYRGASLTVKDKLSITDPILADKVAGGGVFVTFPAVSKESATVRVGTHIRNAHSESRSFVLRTTLLDLNGRPAAPAVETSQELNAGTDQQITQEIQVRQPKLWSPQTPNLYQLRSEVIADGKVIDSEQSRIGIRRIEITKDGFRINGEKMFLRGANRHQEYPYIGNALSDDAQFRDARKIKDAGFDFVRLSHYPQSPAFLDACDELGIVVMDCLMGWQYFNADPAFTELKMQECRQLVRRDRNHPSVALWEVSLNETDMPKDFIRRANAIAHEEYPGGQCFTAGWQNGYDVFVQARQHGGCKQVKDKPCLISEYGDWEYYAQNAGFEQHLWKDLQPAERSSRQLRGDGEVRLLQQALNFQEAHNDNLGTTAFADAIWVMFDYNRGYADDLESSGVMDLFRLPKFSYCFFRSQRDANEMIAGRAMGPMVFIANNWTAQSPLEVRTFSNCEEVALYLNGKLIERKRPDQTRISPRLKHPPVTFKLAAFEPGTLRAVGFVSGTEVASMERRTPGNAADLALRFDLSDKPFAATGADAVFCYAELRDSAGTIVSSEIPVSFGTSGATRLLGQNPIASEAGTASILLGSDAKNPAGCVVYAMGLLKDGEATRILSTAASPNGGQMPRYEVRYTLDGSEPSKNSPLYAKPLTGVAQLRAGIFVNGEILAGIDGRTELASNSSASVTSQ